MGRRVWRTGADGNKGQKRIDHCVCTGPTFVGKASPLWIAYVQQQRMQLLAVHRLSSVLWTETGCRACAPGASSWVLTFFHGSPWEALPNPLDLPALVMTTQGEADQPGRPREGKRDTVEWDKGTGGGLSSWPAHWHMQFFLKLFTRTSHCFCTSTSCCASEREATAKSGKTRRRRTKLSFWQWPSVAPFYRRLSTEIPSQPYQSVLLNDSLLMFKALCKLSQRRVPDTAHPESQEMRSKVLVLELLYELLVHGGPVFRQSSGPAPPFLPVSFEVWVSGSLLVNHIC